MVKVSNIQVDELDFMKEINNLKNKDLQKCIQILGDKNKLKDLLPQKSKITVSFELKETNTDIANGIRRCLKNELEIFSFDFDEYKDLDVSDAYILNDFIKKNIDLLPISQDLEQDFKDFDKLNIELNVDNKTDNIICVTTSDVEVSYNGKKMDSGLLVNKNITICKLRPLEHIYIKNIKIVKGTGKQDGGKFNPFADNIGYKIIDVTPLDEDTNKGTSSMLANPTHFRIAYTTHRNIKNPKKMMVKCCDTLITRLSNILSDVANISNKDDYYYSDLLELETDGNIKKLHIQGEQWTIINMISRFCFILTKGNIKYVSPAIEHYEKNKGTINITHPEFSKLIQSSIKKCIEELTTIKKEF